MRENPTSSSRKPACMKNTRTPATSTHSVSTRAATSLTVRWSTGRSSSCTDVTRRPAQASRAARPTRLAPRPGFGAPAYPIGEGSLKDSGEWTDQEDDMRVHNGPATGIPSRVTRVAPHPSKRKPWVDHWLETVRDLADLKASHPMMDAVID